MRRKTKYNRIVAALDNALEKRGMHKTEMERKIIEMFGLKNKTARNYLRAFLRDFDGMVAKMESQNGADIYIRMKTLYFKKDENQKTISDYIPKNIIYL